MQTRAYQPDNQMAPAAASAVRAVPIRIPQTEHSSPVISIQPKLTVGSPDDPLEREADEMANRVMGPRDHAGLQNPAGMSKPGFIQRKCAHCEEEEKAQRKPLAQSITPFIKAKGEGAVAAGEATSAAIQSSRGSGSRMDSQTNSFMSSRFGTDLSSVNIHTDRQSEQLNRSLAAKAFTVGNDIYFNSGQYQPQSAEGKTLLAHELTHVVQQSHHQSVQRTCSDGKCDGCPGGKKEFWITAYFRREMNEAATKELDKQVATAKAILANCCLDLKVQVNKDRVAGSSTMDAYKPDTTGKDRWRYTADETAVGTGKTFDGAKGLPMLVVDDVPLSGGGVTVDKKFDGNYKGKNYIILGLNQTTTPNPNCNHLAHELWHVGGTDKHDAANGAITACTGNGVSDTYCTNLRALV